MAEIMLVTGGARSGKSAFAERRVAAMAEQVGYIATAQAWDEEMRLRIEIHQQRRPAPDPSAPKEPAECLCMPGCSSGSAAWLSRQHHRSEIPPALSAEQQLQL